MWHGLLANSAYLAHYSSRLHNQDQPSKRDSLDEDQAVTSTRPADDSGADVNGDISVNQISHPSSSGQSAAQSRVGTPGLGDTGSLRTLPPKNPGLREKTWKQQYTSGWHAGALASCFAALVVLIINISVTAWAASSYPVVGHVGVLFHGNCARAKSISTWLQLAINGLSTILLGASNYCMQCLSSPTREEVDRAHSKGLFLRFGVPSAHNMAGIGGKRKALWLTLGLSALPLHFVCVQELRYSSPDANINQ